CPAASRTTNAWPWSRAPTSCAANWASPKRTSAPPIRNCISPQPEAEGWLLIEATSLLRHPGFAQAGEITGFDQGADLRHAPRIDGPQAGNTGITIIPDQPARFGQLSRGAVGVACESIGRGEE